MCLENSGSFRTRYYHESGSWRSSWNGEGGGALINQGYHLLDLWQYLFGLPEALYAEIPFGKYNEFRVDDEATLVMEYPGKVTGTFILTTGEGKSIERLEIAGTKGCIVMEGTDVTLTRFGCDLADYARTTDVTSRQKLAETSETFRFGGNEEAYHIMLRNFAAAMLSGEPLIAPGQDGAGTLSLVNAAYLSAWQGRKVRLPLDGREYAEALKEREAAERAGTAL